MAGQSHKLTLVVSYAGHNSGSFQVSDPMNFDSCIAWLKKQIGRISSNVVFHTTVICSDCGDTFVATSTTMITIEVAQEAFLNGRFDDVLEFAFGEVVTGSVSSHKEMLDEKMAMGSYTPAYGHRN
jgi:hypothetical protein